MGKTGRRGGPAMRVTRTTTGVLGFLLMMSVARAQNGVGASDDEASAQQARRRRAVASAIVAAREAASGREWDAASRQTLVSRLSSLQIGELKQIADGEEGPRV